MINFVQRLKSFQLIYNKTNVICGHTKSHDAVSSFFVLHTCPPSFGWPTNKLECCLLIFRFAYWNCLTLNVFCIAYRNCRFAKFGFVFGSVFLKTAENCHLQIIISYPRIFQECIETFFSSVGLAVQDLVDFSFIFL